jgi:hypothetical protein
VVWMKGHLHGGDEYSSLWWPAVAITIITGMDPDSEVGGGEGDCRFHSSQTFKIHPRHPPPPSALISLGI